MPCVIIPQTLNTWMMKVGIPWQKTMFALQETQGFPFWKISFQIISDLKANFIFYRKKQKNISPPALSARTVN